MPWKPAIEETQSVKVAGAIRIVLGHHLRPYYSDFLRAHLPQDLAMLVQRLDDSSKGQPARKPLPSGAETASARPR